MDILTILRILNIILPLFTGFLCLFLIKHIAEEYQFVKKLKNGRRMLNIVLIVTFLTMGIDSLRSVLIYLSLFRGVTHQAVEIGDSLILIPLNLIRIILLAGFVYVAYFSHKKKG